MCISSTWIDLIALQIEMSTTIKVRHLLIQIFGHSMVVGRISFLIFYFLNDDVTEMIDGN